MVSPARPAAAQYIARSQRILRADQLFGRRASRSPVATTEGFSTPHRGWAECECFERYCRQCFEQIAACATRRPSASPIPGLAECGR